MQPKNLENNYQQIYLNFKNFQTRNTGNQYTHSNDSLFQNNSRIISQQHPNINELDAKIDEAFKSVNIDAIEKRIVNNGLEIFSLKKIGNGVFGVVFKAIYIKDQKLYDVAIKQIKQSNSDLSQLAREINTLNIVNQMNHPNIVKYIDKFYDKDYMYIAMEFCNNGTLSDNKNLSMDQKLQVISQVISALHCLHDNNIAHKDIKLSNILLNTENNSSIITAKLSDFGFSIHEFSTKEDCLKIEGTPIYMSPRLLLQMVNQKVEPEFIALNHIDVFKADDVWALGVTIYRLLSKEPFCRANKTTSCNDILMHVTDKDIMDQLLEKLCQQINNQKITKLLGEMLCIEPTKRAKIADIDNQWCEIIKDYEKQKLANE